MELFREILTDILSKDGVNVSFPNLKSGAAETVELESFKALQRIKAVLENDGLSDFECVERIVCIFEDIGSGCGGRHDF